MVNSTLLPVGVRKDGSYYTRVLWADATENDPTFWVNNLINDDLERSGKKRRNMGRKLRNDGKCRLRFLWGNPDNRQNLHL